MRITSRLLRLVGAAMVPTAVIGTGAAVLASSYSAFSSTTNSPSNSWAAGSVALTNDSASSSGAQAQTGAALFTVTGVTPTTTIPARCLTVSSTGSVPAKIKLYAKNATASNDLATNLNLTIEVGTASGGTNGGSCANFSSSSSVYSGTLAGFMATTAWSNGVDGAWTTAGVSTGSETKAYRITVSPNNAMPNTAQGQRVQTDFIWEAQNT